MSRYSSPTSDTAFQQAVTDQNQRWITVSACAKLLSDLPNFDITTQAGRVAALGRITSVIAGAPYMITDGTPEHSVELRFGTIANAGVVNPAILYVALFCDGWPEYLTQLELAAGFRDRVQEKTTLGNAAILEVDQSKSTPDPALCRSQYNDATVSYRRAIGAMLTLLKNRIGVFNYKTFEAKYQLVWSATAPAFLDPIPTLPPMDSFARLEAIVRKTTYPPPDAEKEDLSREELIRRLNALDSNLGKK